MHNFLFASFHFIFSQYFFLTAIRKTVVHNEWKQHFHSVLSQNPGHHYWIIYIITGLLHTHSYVFYCVQAHIPLYPQCLLPLGHIFCSCVSSSSFIALFHLLLLFLFCTPHYGSQYSTHIDVFVAFLILIIFFLCQLSLLLFSFHLLSVHIIPSSHLTLYCNEPSIANFCLTPFLFNFDIILNF